MGGLLYNDSTFEVIVNVVCGIISLMSLLQCFACFLSWGIYSGCLFAALRSSIINLSMLQCEANDDISKEHQCAVVDIVQALESLPLFSLVKEAIDEADGVATVGACSNSTQSVTNGLPSCRTMRVHYLTMLILFWPYSEVAGCRGSRLQKLVYDQLENCEAVGCQLLRNEVRQLRQQFQSVLGYVNKCCSCHCVSK